MSVENKQLLRVVDLKKHYNGGDVKALDGVSMSVEQGEVVVIIGPSGSGKSTLLRSLNLLEIPTGGHIFAKSNSPEAVDGYEDIVGKKVDIDRHRQKVGMEIGRAHV